jgi:regulator of sirC expression with transglutaminase-like and TPR domain
VSLIDLLARRPAHIELDSAALELARIEFNDLDADLCLRELDDLAFAIADRAQDLSDGERFVAAANQWLFAECGFKGNEADYYSPSNVFLNRVLETRTGMPIALSVIYIEVARRLAKPVFGIGLPGHFLVKYDDGRYSTFIDPFNQGKLLDAEACLRLLRVDSLDAAFFEPVTSRAILMRMINNLRQAYFAGGDSERALRLLDLLIEADPTSPEEHKQRGVALIGMRRYNAAFEAFKRYLELSPEAPDRQRIEEHIRSLAHWMAIRN